MTRASSTRCSTRRLTPRRSKRLSRRQTALPASPGAACGKIYFNAADAVEAATERGEKVVLVRLETSPEDIEGMNAAEGILTARGGMTSHAAVVARGMGTCCVAGCGELVVNEEEKYCLLAERRLNEGDYISLDGSTGNIYAEAIDTQEASLTGDFAKFMGWADEERKLKVRTNADTPKDALTAVRFGAEGIGLCRTEHMFFDEDRIPAVREMIVAKTLQQRQRALDKLLPMQRGDFEGSVQGARRAPGDDSPARPAAPRVPADQRRRYPRAGEGDGAYLRHAEGNGCRFARV